MSQNRFPAFWGYHALPNPIRASPHSKSWKWCDYIDPLLLCNTTICSPSIPRELETNALRQRARQHKWLVAAVSLSAAVIVVWNALVGWAGSSRGCRAQAVRASGLIFTMLLHHSLPLPLLYGWAMFTVMGWDSTALKCNGWWRLFGHRVGNGAAATVLSNEAEETAGRPELASVRERGKS